MPISDCFLMGCLMANALFTVAALRSKFVLNCSKDTPYRLKRIPRVKLAVSLVVGGDVEGTAVGLLVDGWLVG